MENQVLPIVGKRYHALCNGIPVIVRAEGPYTPHKHCSTCTCSLETTMIYTILSDNSNSVPIGSVEIKLLEEVKE